MWRLSPSGRRRPNRLSCNRMASPIPVVAKTSYKLSLSLYNMPVPFACRSHWWYHASKYCMHNWNDPCLVMFEHSETINKFWIQKLLLWLSSSSLFYYFGKNNVVVTVNNMTSLWCIKNRVMVRYHVVSTHNRKFVIMHRFVKSSDVCRLSIFWFWIGHKTPYRPCRVNTLFDMVQTCNTFRIILSCRSWLHPALPQAIYSSMRVQKDLIDATKSSVTISEIAHDDTAVAGMTKSGETAHLCLPPLPLVNAKVETLLHFELEPIYS